MKKFMKKFTITMATIGLALTLSTQTSFAGAEGKGGGGGIKRDGRFLTFGSANLKLRLQPIDDMPGLDLLSATFSGLQIDPTSKAHLLRNLLPSDTRKYFSMDEKDISPEVRAQLIHEYATQFDPVLDEKDLVVYGITVGSETYLYPDFFRIESAAGAAAVLYHETIWVSKGHKGVTYLQIIGAEMEMQKYIESVKPGYNRGVYQTLEWVLERPGLSLVAALMADLQESGALQSLVRNSPEGRYLTVPDLLGVPDTWKGKLTENQETICTSTWNDRETGNLISYKDHVEKYCYKQGRGYSLISGEGDHFIGHAAAQLSQFPKSHFFKKVVTLGRRLDVRLYCKPNTTGEECLADKRVNIEKILTGVTASPEVEIFSLSGTTMNGVIRVDKP